MGRAGPGPGAMGCLPFLYGIKICLTNALLYTKYITCIRAYQSYPTRTVVHARIIKDASQTMIG